MNYPQLNCNINRKNFASIPVRCLSFLLKKLKIYDLFQLHVKDGRIKKGIYSNSSLLMVALNLLLFRSPSKNDFYQNRKLGKSYRNIGALAHLKEDKFPHSKTIDDAFLLLNPSDLEPIAFNIFKQLHSSKLFKNHPSLKKNGTYRLGIDAICTHVYHSNSQHPVNACPFCLKRERKTKDGKIKIWYIHLEVIASLIFEGGFQMPLYRYPIKKEKRWEDFNEKDLKQECEQTALPLVLEKMRAYLPKLKITVLLDGLHANQSTIYTLQKFHFDWDIVLKRLKSVQEEIDSIELSNRLISSRRFNLTQVASFTNKIPYRDLKVNAIEFHEHAEKKTSRRFAKKMTNDVHYQWIVSKEVDKETVFEQAEESRSRWQEEDLFNTLKNRGFHFQHDYSRHPSCQGIWHWLTLIAFCLNSILCLSDLGIKARKTATTYAFMKQMLQDLLYLTYEEIFLCPYPKNLRFTLWTAAG